MKHVRKSVLLWYAPREMYGLVTDVPDYPKFLPWCEGAEVIDRHDDGVTARMHMAMKGVRQSFTTRNVHVANESVVVRLVDGPFSQLDGHWQFHALSSPAGEAATACRIDFEMRYAFTNAAFEAVLSPVFDRVAGTLVDSFVRRAEQVYGPR
jgi:ribosome-associated toxin RatA of RatAB toxin-antitoxin module